MVARFASAGAAELAGWPKSRHELGCECARSLDSVCREAIDDLAVHVRWKRRTPDKTAVHILEGGPVGHEREYLGRSKRPSPGPRAHGGPAPDPPAPSTRCARGRSEPPHRSSFPSDGSRRPSRGRPLPCSEAERVDPECSSDRRKMPVSARADQGPARSTGRRQGPKARRATAPGAARTATRRAARPTRTSKRCGRLCRSEPRSRLRKIELPHGSRRTTRSG